LRYNLISYRLAFGLETASFTVESPWLAFVAEESWVTVFFQLTARGAIREARVIWARYMDLVIEEWQAAGGLADLLAGVNRAILGE
jgi:hypothetical protein